MKDPYQGYRGLAQILLMKKSERNRMKLGWIYAMRNFIFKEDVYKIGVTSRPPIDRAAELSSSTSVYGEFELVYFVHVCFREEAERAAHAALREYRVASNKEFFKAPLGMVAATLEKIGEKYPVFNLRSKNSEIVPQPFGNTVIECPDCGTLNRLRDLLGLVAPKCGRCGSGLPTPLRGK